ncbi:MAG: HIT family protein [Burkholderiales bacterium]|nr:HIT family protein [Burkholderiales bacterium]
MAASPEPGCPLCHEDGGLLIARQDKFRIIRATGPDAAEFPGFYRVVWNDHVAEFSDLAEADQQLCLRAVSAVETVLRAQLAPTKVNLAALGNMVPHLHWHVIARHDWDSRWPAPVWAAPQRAADPQRLAALRARLADCDAAIATMATQVF